MTHAQHREHTFGKFYSAMSRTTGAAAAVCHRPTSPNVVQLRRSLHDALRCVDQLSEVLDPCGKDATDIRSNNVVQLRPVAG